MRHGMLPSISMAMPLSKCLSASFCSLESISFLSLLAYAHVLSASLGRQESTLSRVRAASERS